MRAVNLLPRDDLNKRTKTNVPALAGVTGAVLVTAVLAMSFLSASSSVSDQQATLNGLQQELAAVPPPAVPNPNEGVLAGQQKLRAAALSSALSRRVAWDRVLRELSLVLPQDVWLTSLAASSPASPASVAPPPVVAAGVPPTGFSINGYTYSHDSVARLLARLQVVPDLVGVQLQQSALDKIGTQTIVQFTIVANVRPTAASATPLTPPAVPVAPVDAGVPPA